MHSLANTKVTPYTLLTSVTLLLSLLLVGCIAAVPVAVKYYQEKDFAKFDVQMQGDAKQIYADVVASTKENNPDNMKIEKDDPEALEFEAQMTKASGRIYVVELEVEQADEKMSDVRFLVKGMDGEELVDEAEMKKLGTDAINRFCERTNRSCVIEQE